MSQQEVGDFLDAIERQDRVPLLHVVVEDGGEALDVDLNKVPPVAFRCTDPEHVILERPGRRR